FSYHHLGGGTFHILLVHDWNKNLSSAKYQAPETISIFKQVERPAIGPVVYARQFTHYTRQQEDDCEEPDITPFDFFWRQSFLRNAFVAEVSHKTTQYDKYGKYPRRFKKQVSSDST